MCWWVLSGPVTLHLWVIVWKSTASLRLSCFSLAKKVQHQPWHTVAMEYLTAIINMILIQVVFLMTILYVKTSSNLLTSFSTRPEGKIPTSRQVFKALFTLYYTLLFQWLWWFYGYLTWTKEYLILSKCVHMQEWGKDKSWNIFFWNWSLKWSCFKHSYLQWKSFPHSQSKAYSSQWLLDLCHLQLWQTNKTNCYQL